MELNIPTKTKQKMELNTSPVRFDADTHTYTTTDGNILSGVTPIIAWLFPETYATVPQAVLDRAAQHGHDVHAACQMADNLGLTAEEEPLAANYLRLRHEAHLQPVANEYLISDPRERIASSIDCVMQDSEGNITLCDIKTTAQLHRRNVAVQLSIYADLFEQQNPTLHVARLAAIWLPRPTYGLPQIICLDRLPTAPLQAAVEAYLVGDDYRPHRAALFPDETNETAAPEATTDNVPDSVREAEAAIIDIDETMKYMKERRDNLTLGLLTLMKQHGVKKWETPRLALTYVAPTRRRTLDSKHLQTAYPEAYNACLVESETKESLRITVKK